MQTIYSEDLNSLPGDRQIYIHFGFYKGCKVAIKKINVQNLSLTRSLMLEFKRMKDIQHDHLVRFYGACLDLHPEPFILTEYCPKGSLQDILENETIKLDWMFKISLMHDIVKGMAFLHSTDLHSHGSLKSSNCVVDSRFVLKVTDFGLHQLRRSTDDADIESYAYWQSMWFLLAKTLLKAILSLTSTIYLQSCSGPLRNCCAIPSVRRRAARKGTSTRSASSSRRLYRARVRSISAPRRNLPKVSSAA